MISDSHFIEPGSAHAGGWHEVQTFSSPGGAPAALPVRGGPCAGGSHRRAGAAARRRPLGHRHRRAAQDPRQRGGPGAVAPVGHRVHARRRHARHRAGRPAARGSRRRPRPAVHLGPARGTDRRQRRPDGRGPAPRVRRQRARLHDLHQGSRRRPRVAGPRAGPARGARAARRRGPRRHRALLHQLGAERPRRLRHRRQGLHVDRRPHPVAGRRPPHGPARPHEPARQDAAPQRRRLGARRQPLRGRAGPPAGDLHHRPPQHPRARAAPRDRGTSGSTRTAPTAATSSTSSCPAETTAGR